MPSRTGAAVLRCSRGRAGPLRTQLGLTNLEPREVAFDPCDGTRLMVVNISGRIDLFDIANPDRPIKTAELFAGAWDAAFEPIGGRIVFADEDGHTPDASRRGAGPESSRTPPPPLGRLYALGAGMAGGIAAWAVANDWYNALGWLNRERERYCPLGHDGAISAFVADLRRRALCWIDGGGGSGKSALAVCYSSDYLTSSAQYSPRQFFRITSPPSLPEARLRNRLSSRAAVMSAIGHMQTPDYRPGASA